MSPAEYKRRRQRLLAAIGKESVVLVAAAPPKLRTAGVHYPYRQDSDFLYLTGFQEPEALLVLAPGKKEGAFILFCRPRSEARARWEGPRAGLEGARRLYGADQAYDIQQLGTELPKLLADRQRLYLPLKTEETGLLDQVRQALGNLPAGTQAPKTWIDLGTVLHEQRLRKSKAEQQRLRRAARISAEAHRKLMACCRPGRWEYELEAEFSYACALQGGRFQAYPPIVGGGERGCILHYGDNSQALQDGELVLVDAGCEWEGYASDITRTYPVNGRFSPPQRAIYELVLAAQEAAIAQAVPGNRWNEPHEAAVRVLTQGLVKLGILQGNQKSVPELIQAEAYKPYFMHRTGHWLGLDVHDPGEYKQGESWRILEPGMVFTVEPGLYFPPTCTEVPKRYRGMGIRIEDTLLITETGHAVLSARAPKTVQAIERQMAKAR